MPIRYFIDPNQRLVITTGSGCVTFEDVKTIRSQGLSDPNFNPEFNCLIDFRTVTMISVSSDEARALANTGIFSAESKIALVASAPIVFGVGRMFATYREMSKSPSEIHPFYDLPDALKRLGLESLSQAIKSEGVRKPDI